MPVYNGDQFIAEAIQSVLDQTHQDLELIISNNGSTDNTVAIIHSFQKKDKRVILYDHENFGFGKSLNKSIDLAKFDLIARIDADDVMAPDRLEKQLRFLEKNPDVKVVSCLAYYINGAGKIIGKTTSDITTTAACKRYVAQNEPIGILHPGTVFYKDIFQKVGRYRPQFFPAEDIDLWNRIAETGSAVVVLPEILMKYRIDNTSEITSRFLNSRKKFEWVRDCMWLRRQGSPEISWEAFCHQLDAMPFWKKWDCNRKTLAKYFYRNAGFAFGNHQYFRTFINLFMSIVFQPRYSVPRLIKQYSR